MTDVISTPASLPDQNDELSGLAAETAALFSIDERDPVPAYVQLERRVRVLVADGPHAGRRLAQRRKLAAHLGVSPNTVGRAYAELSREGVIVAKAGGGSAIATHDHLDHPCLRRARQERLQVLSRQAAVRGLALGFDAGQTSKPCAVSWRCTGTPSRQGSRRLRSGKMKSRCCPRAIDSGGTVSCVRPARCWPKSPWTCRRRRSSSLSRARHSIDSDWSQAARRRRTSRRARSRSVAEPDGVSQKAHRTTGQRANVYCTLRGQVQHAPRLPVPPLFPTVSRHALRLAGWFPSSSVRHPFERCVAAGTSPDVARPTENQPLAPVAGVNLPGLPPPGVPHRRQRWRASVGALLITLSRVTHGRRGSVKPRSISGWILRRRRGPALSTKPASYN